MNKRSVVIITIYDPSPNMGNRLQNYAVQNILESFGFEVYTIAFRKPILSWKMKTKKVINQLTNYRFVKSNFFWTVVLKQVTEFEKFNNKYIKTSRIKYIKDIKNTDYYVFGSDQLWNPQWWNKENPDMEKNIYLGTFADPEKLICFSPSFGRDFIPDEWRDWFQTNLSRFPRFSVREESGKKLIKELTGKDAVVTIDPTLMLEKEEWNEFAVRPQNVGTDEKYILTYFLGGRSERVNNDIERYASQIGAKVIYLFDKEYPEYFLMGPSEFLYLIAHAELILTDSFHACVFSFIYERPFLVYNRQGANDMMSRMQTLFTKFDLERKYVDSGLENDTFECDYRVGKMLLVEEQRKVISFLKESMHMEKQAVLDRETME